MHTKMKFTLELEVNGGFLIRQYKTYMARLSLKFTGKQLPRILRLTRSHSICSRKKCCPLIPILTDY